MICFRVDLDWKQTFAHKDYKIQLTIVIILKRICYIDLKTTYSRYKTRTSKDKQMYICHLKEDSNSWIIHWLRTFAHSRLSSQNGVVLAPQRLVTKENNSNKT